MFKLLDGREQLYQWDLDRKIIIEDNTIDEIHFCNGTDDCALVVKTEIVNGQNIAAIPNILLQSDFPIRVYGYCGNCYTKDYARFKVNRRNKPADYVYTETEIYQWNDLEKRVDYLEKHGTGGEIDLEGYVKDTDYATTAKAGILRPIAAYGMHIWGTQGELGVTRLTLNDIRSRDANTLKPVNIGTLDMALSEVLANCKVALINQAAAQEWLGIPTAIENAINAYDGEAMALLGEDEVTE